MKISEQAFLVSMVWLAAFFQIGMWRELRQGGRGHGFYPFGLTFCCCMQALSLHSLLSAYTQSAALMIAGSILGALLCLAIAYGIARIPTRSGRR